MLWFKRCYRSVLSLVGWLLDFFLLVVVTSILFIRPTDFIPGLAIPLYEISIVSCLVVSWPKLVDQFSTSGLRERPTLAFMIGMLLVSVISSLLNMEFGIGLTFVVEFFKVVLFFALLVGVLDSPKRLRLFLACVVVIDLVPISLAILHYHGVIDIPAFTPTNTGDLRRLVATGNFGDPNDVCEILNTAILFCLYALADPRRRWLRFLWLAPILVFGHALRLTASRGGFLGLLGGLVALFWSKYGLKRTAFLSTLALPLVLVVFEGRMTSIDTNEGTGQGRVQIWADALELFRHSPVFGSVGGLGKNVGRAAHNSFVGAYAELGFLGGSFYFGTYFYSLATLARLGSSNVTIREPEIQRMRPFLLAAVASYAVSEMSVTHPFDVTTYAILGLATAGILLAKATPPVRDSRLDGRMVLHVFAASALFLLTLFVYVRRTVHY